MLALLGAAAGCRAPAPPPEPEPFTAFEAQSPSADEAYCAWWADRREGVLYFGESAFWARVRAAGGDPRADLAQPGPLRIGRFDLDAERLLEPIVLEPPPDPGADAPLETRARSGVWDVLALPDGRLFFTTFFGPAGFVDPATGVTTWLPEAGPYLNELAHGPDGRLLATRYSGPGGRRTGSLVVLDAEGAIEAEWPLEAGAGFRIAPKSLAWDRQQGAVWITTDLLDANGEAVEPEAGRRRGDVRPTILVGLDGRERRRVTESEIQFVVFDAEGAGHLARVGGDDDRTLELVVFPAGEPGRDLDAAPRVVLDTGFAAHLDFVQEIRVADDGRVVLTLWSGKIFVVERADDGGPGEVHRLRLPSLEPGGLYYTAVARGARLCASYCGGVRIVCTDAPNP